MAGFGWERTYVAETVSTVTSHSPLSILRDPLFTDQNNNRPIAPQPTHVHDKVVLKGWAMESTLEAHVKRVRDRLEVGRVVLTNLGADDHEKNKEKKKKITTYDIEGVVPDLEQTTLSPPRPDDRFFVATDERDPRTLRAIRDGGGVLLTDLLTMEDRRAFGWSLMLTDVRAIAEQGVLAHSAYYCGHAMSSFSGRVENLRAARGADRRTALLD